MVSPRRAKMEKRRKRSRSITARLLKSSVTSSVIVIDSSDEEPLSKHCEKNRATVIPSKAGTSSDNRKSPKKRSNKSPKKSEMASEQKLDQDDPEVKEIVRSMEVMRDILGRDYVNVVNRLKLNWTPYCVETKEYCRSHHHRKCPRPKVVDQLESCLVHTFTKHNRTLHYLRAVQNMCIRSEFPGEDAIKKVLEMILISEQPRDSPYPTDYIVQHCILVAEMIIMKFPPCWPDINKVYRKVLTEGINVKNFHRGDTGSKRSGNFAFVIDLLLETITKPEVVHPTSSTNHSESDEETFYSFDHWVVTTTTEDNFSQLTRHEKLDRLFAVLNVYTKILEYDLSIWLLRYPSKATSLMLSENGPLLTSALFDGNVMTSTVKKFVEVFVNCICFQFPNHATDVLSRLMNLLAVSTECCEKQQLLDQVVYPNIGPKIDQLAKIIFKTVLNKFSCKVHYFLLVIKSIKVPFVKYLVIDQLLRRLNPDHEEMNVKKIYLLFQRKRWQCSEGTRQIEEATDSSKYPVIPTKLNQKTKADEIFMQEYLQLLLDCLQAYCDAHRIREVIFRAFVKKSPNVAPTSANHPPPKVQTNKKYHMDKIEADIHELERQVNRKRKFAKHVVEELPYTGVYVGNNLFLRYREDVKYLGILLSHITPLYKNDPVMFADWYKFLDKILSP